MGNAAGLLATGFALALSALAPGPARAAVPAARCAPPEGTHVVRSTGDAVVTVEKHSTGDDIFVDTDTRTWRGCSRTRGVQVVLDSGTVGFSGGHSASGFKLAGAFTVFVAGNYTRGDRTEYLTVVDLGSGHEWTSAGTTTGFAETAVNRRGAAAWIRTSYDPEGHMRWQLFSRPSNGPVVLRYRSSLPLTHLSLTDRRLQWRERTKLRTREL